MSRFDFEDDEDWKALSTTERVAMLKTTLTMTDVVELHNYDVNSLGKVRPPWNPTERTPSTHLYEDHFYDYGSGKHGDIFDWMTEEAVAAGKEPRTLRGAANYLRRLALRGGREPGDVEKVPVRKIEDLFTPHISEALPYDILGYPTSRYGVRIDVHNDILVPHWEKTSDDQWIVYGIKIRKANGGKSSVPGSQFTHRLYDPFGWCFLAPPNDACIITEGESDCWAMIDATKDMAVDVFALPSGAGAWKDHWLEDLEPYRQVLLCFDNDKAGKQALDKVMRKVGYDRAKELKVPGLYNDAREAIGAGWVPSL